MAEGLISQAFCIALALIETSFKASSKPRHPLATNAENSPREWPATTSGLSTASVLKATTECKNTAGCVTLVCFKASALPVNIMSEIRNPNISFADSNNAFADS